MNRPVRRTFLILGLLLLATEVDAQCADGSPPPCGVRQAAARRPVNPPLDARQWIVVPFGNVTRAADVDWLRDASVNLLTLEIGRWNDLRVVSDKRVADLLKPAGASDRPLTLNEGLEIARRAGAGMLVMGDFMKLGGGVRVTANVFDVKTGRRVRTAEQRLGTVDSLLNAFGPLSRGVLALQAPVGERSGEIGTASLDAYQAYLDGMRAFNQFHFEDASRHFMRAIDVDSTFALALLQVSMIRMWGEPSFGEASLVRRYALAAQRVGGALPPRERAFINWAVHSASLDYRKACDAVAPVVARDSSDVLALYMLGDCAFHDNVVTRPVHDSLPASYKYGWNVALNALRRAVMLDPSFSAAFPHLLDVLKTPTWTGCLPRETGQPCDQYRAVIFRDGDSLLIQPMSMARNSDGYWKQVERSARERPMVANLAFARRLAEDWLSADPVNSGAAAHLAQVYLLSGNIAAADSVMRTVPTTTAFSANIVPIRVRMEIAVKLGRGAEARAWFDSLAKAIPDQPSVMLVRGSMELVFGRTRRVMEGLLAQPAVKAAGAAGEAWAHAVPRLVTGLPVPDIASIERAYLAAMPDTATCALECRLNRAWFSQTLGTRGRGDTAKIRRDAFVHDSSARGNVAMLWPDFGWSVIASELYLAIGDTANALRSVRFATDTAMMISPHAGGFRQGIWNQGTWSRIMLQRAELAAATKNIDEARKWYDRVLDLWADADREFQPDVARIRAARAALGGPAIP